MQVQSLGWEDSLEEGTATHSIILAWRIPWTEEPNGLWPRGVAKSQTRLKQLSVHHNCASEVILRLRPLINAPES